MHVAIFYKQFLGEGGFPREWRRFALELAQLDVQITVFCFSNKKPPDIHKNIVIQTYTGNKKPSFTVPKPLFDRIETDKNDIDIFELVACYEPENITLMKFLKKQNIPYVVAPLGHLAPRIIQNDWWKKLPFIYFLLKPRLKHAAGMHSFSQLESSWIKKLTNSPIIQACHGSFYEDIPDNLDSSYLRNIISLPDNHKIILYLGRLDITGKGLLELLDGFNNAKKSHHNISLVLLGPEEKNSKQKLLKKINDASIDDVHIIDPIYDHNKYNALASADVFIYPSKFDILPRAVREALTVGCPSIVSTETHFGDLIQKYDAGAVCDVNANSIANKISVLLDKKTELHSMRNNAKKLSTQALNWSKEAEKLKEGLESLMTNQTATSTTFK